MFTYINILHRRFFRGRLFTHIITTLHIHALNYMERFYCCYLLQSKPKPRSFYIGSTPDPIRRIRQHNGLISQGAFKTRTGNKRPWSMICIVSGFPSKISALQFEHAWQHAYQTRHINRDQRVVNRRNELYGNIHKYIANLRLLLNSPAFSRLPLIVHLFEKSAYDTWMTDKYKISVITPTIEDIRETEDETNLIGGGKFLQQQNVNDEEYLEKSLKLILSAEGLDPTTDLVGVCPNSSCQFYEPLTDLAKRLLAEQNQLIPVDGKCPSCHETMNWSRVVFNAQKISKKKSGITES